jgi:tellurite resistance protein
MLFGIGALLWVMLQPALLNRIVSGPALPPRLRPTLAILLAPPAVGSLALATLTGDFGAAPLAVLGLAVFLALVLATMGKEFLRVPFGVSWWALTFPSAALCAAVLGATSRHPGLWPQPVLWSLLIATSLIVGWIAFATARAAMAGELLKPEA